MTSAALDWLGPTPTVSPPPASLVHRVVAVLTVVAIGLLVTHVPLASSLARRNGPTAPVASHPGRAGIDAQSVIERSQHTVASSPTGALTVGDALYRATFDAAGLSYRPASSSSGLGISLSAIDHGAARVALDTGRWTANAQTAERSVGSGVRERVSARNGEIEWDIVLARPLAGRGDLHVVAQLTGVIAHKQVGKAGHPALQLTLAGGAEVALGQIVVRDAGGRELNRSLPSVNDDHIVLHVPGSALVGARYPVTVDPTVSATTPVTPSGDYGRPAVAFNGTNYLVVSENVVNGSNFDIYGALVSSDGSSVGAPVAIATRTQDEFVSDVAWNGTEFAVVWEESFSSTDADVRGQLLSPSLAKIGSEISIAADSSNEIQPAIAAGGSQFLVTWSDDRNGTREIFATRLSTGGAPMDLHGIRLSLDVTETYNSDSVPDVAWNGSQYLVVWENRYSGNGGLYEIQARLVNPDGSLDSGNAIALWDQVPHHPAVASDGTKFLVVWVQGTDIIGTRVDPTSGVLGPMEQLPISTAAGSQLDPAITFNGGSYFVAWQDRRNSSHPDIYATRVAPDGTVQDTNGFAVAGTSNDEDSPAVAAGPNGKWGTAYESGPLNATTIEFNSVSSK